MHPLIEAAARGELPSWTRMVRGRVAHAHRVAELLSEWARAEGLREGEHRRWKAAGLLHDVLKDEDPGVLRTEVPRPLDDLPEPVLHGPAAAVRLRREGVEDEELLHAVAWHTLGHPELDRMGRAVYAADFLEPGRDLENEWRTELRSRMPGAMEEVVREILRARIRHLMEENRPVRGETLAFWNRLVSERGL